MARTTGVTVTLPITRSLLGLAGILVITIGVPLNLAPENTATAFAWTIGAPMTTTFLGGAYWAAAALALLAARERIWANARVAVPAVLAFAVLTLGVTLQHLDRFHLAATDGVPWLMAWVWLVVYITFPVLFGAALMLQVRLPRADPPVRAPMAGWVRSLLVGQGFLLAVVGLALLLAPTDVAPLWPWELTPLTGRVIGAWLVGLAIVSLQMRWEADWVRLRPAVASSAVFVVLQLSAIVRFGMTADWTRPLGLALLALLGSLGLIVAVGAGRVWGSRD